MQPFVALLGIVMGSSVALLAGLGMTLGVFLLMPGFHDRLAEEFSPLLQAVGWAGLLTATSAAAFVGQLKAKSWRLPAQFALLVSIAVVGLKYWPA